MCDGHTFFKAFQNDNGLSAGMAVLVPVQLPADYKHRFFFFLKARQARYSSQFFPYPVFLLVKYF